MPLCCSVVDFLSRECGGVVYIIGVEIAERIPPPPRRSPFLFADVRGPGALYSSHVLRLVLVYMERLEPGFFRNLNPRLTLPPSTPSTDNTCRPIVLEEGTLLTFPFGTYVWGLFRRCILFRLR